jgi:hypothetical protein
MIGPAGLVCPVTYGPHVQFQLLLLLLHGISLIIIAKDENDLTVFEN